MVNEANEVGVFVLNQLKISLFTVLFGGRKNVWNSRSNL